MILKLIITIDFPNSATLKLIVENFTDKRLVALENFTNSNKFIYLKLVYKSLSTVYKEKGKNNDNNALILHEIMKNYIVSCLSNLVKSLKYDSELIISSIRNLTNSVEDLSKLEDLLNKLDENYFLQSAKYIMKIFTLFHIVSKEKSLGGNELIIMAQTFHNFCKINYFF